MPSPVTSRSRLFASRLIVVALVVCTVCGCIKNPASPDPPAPPLIEGIPGGSGAPTLQFTKVPEYGTTDNLEGVALHVKPGDFRVAVFIRVENAWWTKPYFSTPTVAINANGTWICDVTTGGIDQQATELVAFLLPASFQPPLASGQRDIPTAVSQNAVARMSVTRTPRLRRVSFSGYSWQVKTSGNTVVGPGPNYFSDDQNSVYVDPAGALHLRISKQGSTWRSSEVILERSLGYGRYTFTIDGGFEQMNQNAVLGLFTWDIGAPDVSNREIDIEFSRWGSPGNINSQFVVQPYTVPGNIFRFDRPLQPMSTHMFQWSARQVDFESGVASLTSTRWTYSGSSVPAPGAENVRMNLWLFNGVAPTDDREIEVVIRSFQFQP